MTAPLTTKGKALRETYEQRLAATCARRGHDMERGSYMDERGHCVTWERCQRCARGTVVTLPVVFWLKD
jgi:hypothetical protein